MLFLQATERLVFHFFPFFFMWSTSIVRNLRRVRLEWIVYPPFTSFPIFILENFEESRFHHIHATLLSWLHNSAMKRRTISPFWNSTHVHACGRNQPIFPYPRISTLYRDHATLHHEAHNTVNIRPWCIMFTWICVTYHCYRRIK